ncbi:MAG: RNA-binding S4 domain-containing protein [Burkholderiaceae bacterium]
MQRIDFELRGEHIALDALLKATGLAPSGGGAKAMVADGRVKVDGREELRKTCKIRAGQVVGVTGARVHVNAPAPESSEPEPDRNAEDGSEPPAAGPT